MASDIPTQPSHTNVFTGRFGVNTRIVAHFHPPASLDGSVPWLPSIMQTSGRPTGAVDHLFAMKDWFIRGYDDYMPPPGRSRSPASVVNGIAFPWIAHHAQEDFFLFLHYWDAHIPYVPPSPFRERYTHESFESWDPATQSLLESRPSYPLFKRNLYDFLGPIPNLQYIADLYDAEIAYLDHEIGNLVGYLHELGILDDTVLVLFGDHGENMTEHDAWFDHAGLYDSVVHVPVMIRYPAAIPATHVEGMIQLVDLMPTVLELAGMPVPEGMDGKSLMPLIRGEERMHRDCVIMSECTWQASRAVRTMDWKYIRNYHPGVHARFGPELYDLRHDPAEQVNLALARPDVVGEMEARLQQWLRQHLQGSVDPMLAVLGEGLPAIDRLVGVIKEDARVALDRKGEIDLTEPASPSLEGSSPRERAIA